MGRCCQAQRIIRATAHNYLDNTTYPKYSMYIFVFSIIQFFFLSVKLANAFSPYYLELLQEFRSTILARANRPLHSIRTERFKFIAKWFRFGKNSAGSSNSQIFFSPDTCLSSSLFFVCASILPFKYIKSICNLFELLKTFILDLYIIDLINWYLARLRLEQNMTKKSNIFSRMKIDF